MNHFLFTQVCCSCKKSFKTFKILLSYYDERFNCTLSEDEMKLFSFICLLCNTTNAIDFRQICNPFTLWYLTGIEINNRIDEEINNLLILTKEKLNLQKNKNM